MSTTEQSRKRKRTSSPISSPPSSPRSPTAAELQNAHYHVKAVTTTPSSTNDSGTKSSSGAKYHCNYCKKDISNKVRIKCAQCQDFDLCVDCFFVGVETASHKNNHSYRVMDDLSAPLFTVKWSADEELLLLEGIEQFGLGNWGDISDHVGTKSRWECEYHYWLTYIDVPTFPVPTPRDRLADEPHQITANDVKKNDEGMLLCLDKGNIKKHENKKRKVNYQKISTLGAELSYMPLRGDFIEKEFENEAEDIIAEMEISENDADHERRRKLQLLELYNYMLDERDKRKKFALERGIIADWKKICADEKKKSNLELNAYRKFARFLTAEKFTLLMESLSEEKRIAKRIEQLQNYRRSGIMSLEQGEQCSKKSSSIVSVNMLSSSLAKTPYCYVSKSKTNPSGRFRGDDHSFNIIHYPGAELLSLRERDLCTEAKITPRAFMVLKDAIIREGFRLNYMGLILTKKMACDFLASHTIENEASGEGNVIERSQIGLVYDFLVMSGWLTIYERDSQPKIGNDKINS